ncbi:nuclear transport factor 2 family protein [Chitinophaga qingshengii]|uniref:Nuclear transport factor 2 family protein n=1 Tax=Chitinophaga qingshengii TaxID=1569794 RepID=A0ABR7TQZ3_9BACT|nr:nuclear transport factor 2 family protein [Chitinophaga qingshengii]MBC9932914.1 hypothetical protein [Chitinophaga qingshengii]
MRYLSFLLMGLFAVNSLQAQSEADAVKQAIDKLFTAMHDSDSTAVRACFSPTAVFQTIDEHKGVATIKNVSVERFASIVGNMPKGEADERISYGAIQIDDRLASAWTPYRFYHQGKFHHCGVNSFQLVKLGREWKIQYIIDTRRKDKCVEDNPVQ